jgi:hypothetical protein
VGTAVRKTTLPTAAKVTIARTMEGSLRFSSWIFGSLLIGIFLSLRDPPAAEDWIARAVETRLARGNASGSAGPFS